MKRRIGKFFVVLLVLVMASGTFAFAENNSVTVSLRIEGKDANLYYNTTMMVSFAEKGTMRDVINSYNGILGVQKITMTNEATTSRITQVGALQEKSIGSPVNDEWLVRVNGVMANQGLDGTEIKQGDEIVIYYGDAQLMQYPNIDFSRMMSDGIVKLTSQVATVDDAGNTYMTEKPVSLATVIWDGMTYTSDENGAFIIDSTGAGIRHTIQIERYDASGLPTVLRMAPDAYIKYGFADVSQDDWYFSSVIFVSERALLSGLSEKYFGPETPMNRAMFVTLLGRLASEDVDHSVNTGFPDVINDGWSTGYISWASENELVTGYPDGTFGQYVNVSREQIAVLFYRYAIYRSYDTTLANSDMSVYTDFNKVSDYAKPAMRWALEKGIVKGSDRLLNPLEPATRAQVATLLERFLTEYGDENTD